MHVTYTLSHGYICNYFQQEVKLVSLHFRLKVNFFFSIQHFKNSLTESKAIKGSPITLRLVILEICAANHFQLLLFHLNSEKCYIFFHVFFFILLQTKTNEISAKKKPKITCTLFQSECPPSCSPEMLARSCLACLYASRHIRQ